MSTVKVVNVQHPSASTAAVTLAADGSMTGSFPAPNRNLLYNGAMQCHQRGTSTASITGNGYYTADRWYLNNDTLGTWTQSVENDAPTGSGLRKSLKMLCTTADSSPASGDFLCLQQRLEGQDVQRLAKGTSSAQQVTLSFWVKSNVTGTFLVSLLDIDNSRMVIGSYSISSSGAWERKTVTFPADTTGALDNDSNLSLVAEFQMGAGSNFTSGTLQTTWASIVNANRAVGQTNLAAATNNYWQVTGVQLEVGPVATGFEFKSFGQELRECQRYYWRSVGGEAYSVYGNGNTTSTTNARATVMHPVPMRVAPTSIDASNLGCTVMGVSTAAATVTITASGNNYRMTDVTLTGTGFPAAGTGIVIASNNNTAAYIGFSAEL